MELILVIPAIVMLYVLFEFLGDPDLKKGGYVKRAKKEGFIPFEDTSKQKYDEETWRSMLTEEQLEIRKKYYDTNQRKREASLKRLSAESSYTNKTDELVKLKSLLDDGALTKKEFEDTKKEILSSNINQKQTSNSYSCSRCSGTNFKRVRSTGGKIAGGILAPKSRSECQTCGHKNQF